MIVLITETHSVIDCKTASLRKQSTFRNVTTGFPAKQRLRNENRKSILMTCHYPDLGTGSASAWSCRVGNFTQPIRSTTQIWEVTRHQYRISALVSQKSFGRETSGSVGKSRLFSQAKPFLVTLISIAFCFRCRLPNQDHEFRGQMYCTSALGHRWARKVLITFSDKIGVHTVACERSHIPVVASLHPKIWTKHSIPDTNNLP